MTSSAAAAASSSRRARPVCNKRWTELDGQSAAAAASSKGLADEVEVPLPIEQLLPGHKIARGRGRRKQLEQMTEQEKRAEKESRMEKMRISARECRKRKKKNVAGLEKKLRQFEKKEKWNTATIRTLRDEMRVLREHLAALATAERATPSSSASSPPQLAFYERDCHVVPQLHRRSPSPEGYGLHEHAHALADPAAAVMMAEEMPPQQQQLYEAIAEEGLNATLSSVSAMVQPALSFEKRSGFAPAALTFSKLGSTGDAFRVPALETPFTPLCWLEMSGLHDLEARGGPPFTPKFAFDELESVLLG